MKKKELNNMEFWNSVNSVPEAFAIVKDTVSRSCVYKNARIYAPHLLRDKSPIDSNGVRHCLACNSPLPDGRTKYCSKSCKSTHTNGKQCVICNCPLVGDQSVVCSKACKGEYWQYNECRNEAKNTRN